MDCATFRERARVHARSRKRYHNVLLSETLQNYSHSLKA